MYIGILYIYKGDADVVFQTVLQACDSYLHTGVCVYYVGMYALMHVCVHVRMYVFCLHACMHTWLDSDRQTDGRTDGQTKRWRDG